MSACSIPPDPAELARLHVSCDGKWPGVPIFCFTDHDPVSPAYKASFDVQLPIDLPKVLAARDAKRRLFAAS